jgi:hypothetical protein
MFNKKYNLIEKVTKIKTPKELISFWKKVESSEIDNRYFYYKYFGKVIPMSPDRINKYSSLAPLNGDRHAFYGQIYNLTKSGEISTKQEQEIIQNSFWDPYVMSIHLNNQISNFCKTHYLKFYIPIATTHGSSEIVFLGFTESKNYDGVFYYNSYFQKLPIFICKTIEEFTNKIKEEKCTTQTLLQLLGNQYCYNFKINEEFNLDKEEIENIFKFISESFKNTFQSDFHLLINEEFIELNFEYRGFQRYLKFNTENLRHTESLQMVIMAINNSITEFDKNFINNYKYYLSDDTIQLLHKDQAVKYIRKGLIKPYSNNPIPQIAYTSLSKKPKKYEAELMKMIKDKNWSQIEIDRFIDIYGDTGFNK